MNLLRPGTLFQLIAQKHQKGGGRQQRKHDEFAGSAG